MSLYFFPEARTTDAPNEIFSPSEYFRTARMRSPRRDLQEFGTPIERRDLPLLSYAPPDFAGSPVPLARSSQPLPFAGRAYIPPAHP
jgi:hypothetical protein